MNALFELGLVLLGLTIVINVVAMLMVRAITSAETRRVA
jgi:ABC-type phosphate transport system permease subunit